MKKPNVLIFFVDQQRGDTIYPYERAITPNVTDFCKQGLSFSQCHTIAPHCAPSRASIFSGLYPTEHGVWNNVNVGNRLTKGLYDGIKLFSEDFKEAGYRMYYHGKWHVSSEDGATDRGFDFSLENREYKRSNTNPPADTKEWRIQHSEYIKPHERQIGEIVRNGYPKHIAYGIKDEHNDDIVMASAMEVLCDRNAFDKKIGINSCVDGEERPWFQVVSTGAPHDAYFTPKRFYDLYKDVEINLPKNFYDDMKDKPNLHRRLKEMVYNQLSEEEHKDCIRHYLATCSYEDDLFGKILAQLEKNGEADNTIVLYIADHGDYMAEHGIWAKGLPCYEGAYHIPMAFRWPKGIVKPNRIIDDFTTLLDVAPTLLEACDIKVDREFSGNSLVDYMKDKEPVKKQEVLFTQSNGNELYGIQRSVKTKDWKYIYNGFDFDELYDLKNDPDELHNVFDKYKNTQVVHDLCKTMWQFAKDKGDTCVNSYIMVGLSPYGPSIVNEE